MRTIEVIPNPFIALDKDGVPQGVVSAGMPGVFIGARIDLVASRKTGKTRFYFPKGKDGAVIARKVVLSAEIVTAVQAGELLVAKVEDALLCGLTEKEFLAPEKILEAEEKKALAYWQSLRGKDAKLGAIPHEAEEEAPGEEAPARKASEQITPTVKMTKQAATTKAEG